MKNVLIKSGIVVFLVFIFLNTVIICMSGARRLEYMSVAELAKKNAELVKPITNPPGQSYGTADESLLKNSDEPFTAEDFSYMVIDGIRIDMPCTVGDLAEHFGIRYIGGYFDSKQSVLYACKDDVPFMMVNYDINDSKPPYFDGMVHTISFNAPLDGAYIPEIIVGGINIASEDTSVFQDFQVPDADGEEYVFVKKNLIFEMAEGRYVQVDNTASFLRIHFYDSYDEMCEEIREEEMKEAEFKLLTREIRLSDTYDPESYEPISLEGIDLSEMDVEIMENPGTCIYDELRSCSQKNDQGAIAKISDWKQVGNDAAYLEGVICGYDDAGNALEIFVKALLRNGQELGEALVLEREEITH